jgi:hypothetical protein
MESRNTERELRNISTSVWALARNARGSLVNRSLLLAFSLVVIDLLLVSYMQPTTAYALIQHSAPLALLSGVLLSIGPWLLQVATIYFVLGASFDAAVGSSPRLATRLLCTAVAVATTNLFVDRHLALSTAQGVWLGLAAAGVFIFGEWLTRGGPWDDDSAVRLTGLAALVAGAIFVGWYADGADVREALVRPYLPAEVVFVQTEGVPFRAEVGYVLSSDATWTIIMREKDRHIVVTRTEAVLEREVCETRLDHKVRPPERLIENDPPAYRTCLEAIREH